MKVKPKLSQEEIEAINKEKANNHKKSLEHKAFLKGALAAIYKNGYKFLDFPYQGATICYRVEKHNVVSFSIALLNPQDKWDKNEGRYQAWNFFDFGNGTKIKVKNPHARNIRYIFQTFLEMTTGKYTPEQF